jgi:hypothetical protein
MTEQKDFCEANKQKVKKANEQISKNYFSWEQ